MTKDPTLRVLALLLVLFAVAAVTADATNTVNGEAVELSSDLRSLTLDAEDGRSLTFEITDETRVLRDGFPVEPSEIDAGDSLTVNYRTKEETKVAVTIGIHADKA